MKNDQTYAVFSTGGKQYRVSEGEQIAVELLDEKIGKKVTFDSVLLVSQNGKVSVGNPTVSGASVSATLEEKFRGEKIHVFKKKRRKGYQKKTGHRQNYHMLTIDSISMGGKAKPAAAKEDKAEETAKKAEPKKAAEKPAAKSSAKKAPAKKAAEKKPAAKKPAAKKPAAKKSAAKKPAAKKAAPKKTTKASKPKAEAKTSKKAEAGDKE